MPPEPVCQKNTFIHESIFIIDDSKRKKKYPYQTFPISRAKSKDCTKKARGNACFLHLFCFLSLLIQHQFRIYSILFIRAHKQKIHAGNHAETAFSAKFTSKLTAEICLAVIQKLYRFAVRQGVRKIYRPLTIRPLSTGGIVRQGVRKIYRLSVQRIQRFDRW